MKTKLTTEEKQAQWLKARTELLASGNTLASVLQVEVDAGVQLPPNILIALGLHDERKAAEEAAYQELIGDTE